jgi:hypothetical protein
MILNELQKEYRALRIQEEELGKMQDLNQDLVEEVENIKMINQNLVFEIHELKELMVALIARIAVLENL